MKKGILLLNLLLGTWLPQLASAQGPWAVHTPSPPYPAFFFSDELQLPAPNVIWQRATMNYGMGSFGYMISASGDEGQTWQQQSTGELRSLSAIDAKTAWIVRQYAPVLQKTTSGPSGFAAVEPPSTDLQVIHFFTASTGILIAGPAAGTTTWSIYRTIDGGSTWSSIGSPNLPPAISGDFARGGTSLGDDLWIPTVRGAVLHSSDQGKTWTSSLTGLAEFASVSFRTSTNGLAVGRTNGKLVQTTDGGQTWTMFTPVGPVYRTAVAAVPNSVGTYLSVGSYSEPGTSITTDNGATWQGLENTIAHFQVTVGSASRIWSSGLGALYRYTGTPLATRSAKSGSLSLYPNPTTGVVNIAPIKGQGQITIYDNTGRLVRSSQLATGATMVDLTELSAGLYHLQVSDEAGVTRKQSVVVAP